MEPRDPTAESSLRSLRTDNAAPLVTVRADEVVDCWNQVGVAGDGSCAELAKVIHCRNCPVYSAAGASLLNQDLPPNYRRDWTQHFSREKIKNAPGKISVVIFRIGAERLALPTSAFQEVAERRTIHSVPHRKLGIALGLINVRGELLLCVSLGKLLGVEPADGGGNSSVAHHRLVVAEWEGSVLAFPVDEIYGIHRYQPQDLSPLPNTVARAETNFTHGILKWEGQMVGCLDAELVFSTLNRSLT